MNEAENKNDNEYDIFISYSSKNKNLADAVVSRFENSGIKCWYAPRDIMPGQEWVSAIREGLNSAYIFVLIYTEDSNLSRQVMNEVALAFNAGKTLVPFRLTEEMMNDELEYYLTRVHWLDAVSKPLEAGIDSLYDYISVILEHLKKGDTLIVKRLQRERNTGLQEAGKPEANTKKKKILFWSIGTLALVLVIVGICIFVNFGKSSKNDGVEPDDHNSGETLPGTSDEKTGTKSGQSSKNESGSEGDESTAEQLMEEGYRIYTYEVGADAYERARECFEKAAEMGDADAYFYLGGIYEEEYDFKAAKSEYEKGISGGSNLSRLGLGSILQKGLSGEADMNKAWELYNEALENGCVEADYYRALMILYGYAGQNADAEQAVSLLNNVIKTSKMPDYIALSYFQIGDIYRRGVLGISRDYDKAIDFYEKAYKSLESLECKKTREFSLGITYEATGESVKADDHYRLYMEICKEAMDAGSIPDFCYYGLGYYYGYGVEQNYNEAMKWFEAADKKAKEKNENNCSPDALDYLGTMYRYGLGCEKDYEKAYEYFKEAADFGYGYASKSIGNMYLDGLIGQDEEGNYNYDMARQWYEKALDHGCQDAYSKLGEIYSEGLGVDIDKDIAKHYLLKGASCGSGECIWQLAENSDSPEEMFRWVQILANFDEANANGMLGVMYLNGYGVEENEDKAIELLKTAANARSIDALEALTGLYYNGEFSFGEDYPEAFKYAQKGAVLEDPYCMFMLGKMYNEGQGTEINYEKAEKWLLKAAEAGETEAMVLYGSLKLYGNETIIKSRNEGIAWLEKSGENGNYNGYLKLIQYYVELEDPDNYVNYLIEAYEHYGSELPGFYIYALAECYYKGISLDKDDEKAFELANISVEKNDNAEGMKLLGTMYKYGAGTEIDSTEALRWYSIALKSGLLSSKAEEEIYREINDMIDKGMVSKEYAESWLN